MRSSNRQPHTELSLACRVACMTMAMLLAACASLRGGDAVRLRPAQYGAYEDPQRSVLTTAEEEQANALCPFGIPAWLRPWDHGFTEYVVRDGYALEHSGELKIPLWVCERLEPRHLSSRFERTDRFRPDTELEGPRSELADYRGSGYARGHHAPAEDHAWNRRLLDETFFLSNMSPQVGGFNSGVWSRIEARTRDWAAQGRVTWVITGSMLYDPAEEDRATADGWVRYSQIGTGVAVPTHLFKIVVNESRDGDVRATAFVLANAKPKRPYGLGDFVRPVQWIEQRTGFDFMPDLDPGDAARLEGPDAGLQP